MTRWRGRGRNDAAEPEPSVQETWAADATDATGPGAALRPVTMAPWATGGAAREVAADWRPGDHILDLYEVIGTLGRGGMGVVYHVRHLGWDTDLAVKSPHPELFRGDADRERFVREAESWVSLGLHPHVCGCHYVRMLGGVPRVFAEYLDGGSLREWIDDGRLYHGGPEDPLVRVLDVAVQIAWGLDHAHVGGLVHQDVKPANILLERTGTAKVTDFGLARARTVPGGASAAKDIDDGASVLVEGGGMTPAYASPEQAAGLPVGRRTDVWSFAVSVLEMCVGEVTWMAGPVAGAALADVRDRPGDLPVALPRTLADLLARCLADDPADRPSDMAVVAAELIEIMVAETGRPYPREAPRPAELRADQLNNRALSLLDLGRVEDAKAAFAEAHAIDPQHAEAVYNLGLLRWRTGRGTDQDLLDVLETVRASTGDSARGLRLLASVHLERGDRDAALPLLKAAARMSPDDREIQQALRLTGTSTLIPVQLLGSLKLGGETTALSLSADAKVAVAAGWAGRRRRSSLYLWQPPERRARQLKDHDRDHRLNAAALTADGGMAVVGSAVGSMYVWDTEQGHLQREIGAHHEGLQSLAVSGDGRIALSVGWGYPTVTAGEYDHVRLWDLPSGGGPHLLGTVRGGRGDGGAAVAIDAHLSADGRVAVTGSSFLDEPRVWSTSAGSVKKLSGHSFAVGTVFLSGDGRLALTGGVDKTIRLWEVDTGRCLRVLHGHAGQVHSVAMNGDGRYALSGGADKTVRLWDLDTGRCLYTLRQDDALDGVRHVALSADGRYALTGAADGVRFWRLPLGLPGSFQPCRPRSHAELTHTAARITALLDEGEHAITDDRYPYALAVLTEARAAPGYERAPEVMAAWRRLGRVAERTGLRGVWPVRVLEGHEKRINASCLSRDGRLAVSVSQDGTIRVWDVATGRCLRSLKYGDPGDTYKGSVALSADGRSVLLAYGHSIDVWDLDSGRKTRTFDGHTKNVHRIRLCADGRLVMSASYDGTIRVWEVATGRCTATIEAHPPSGPHVPNDQYSAGVWALAASADGRLALSTEAGYDPTVWLWDVATGRLLRTFKGHASPPRSVVLIADKRLMVSAGHDGTIRVWSTTSGRCRRVINTPGEVVAVDVTTDGRFAVSCGYSVLHGHRVTDPNDLRVQLWDLRTGRCLQALEGHTGAVESLSLSRDDRYVLSGDRDGTLRLWELDWDLELPGG
jgi:WD40 repeat protein/serine/threonine protein kinase